MADDLRSFHIERVVNGLDVRPLGRCGDRGTFTVALHSMDQTRPPYPMPHGCVRVSTRTMGWTSMSYIAPIGSRDWIS